MELGFDLLHIFELKNAIKSLETDNIIKNLYMYLICAYVNYSIYLFNGKESNKEGGLDYFHKCEPILENYNSMAKMSGLAFKHALGVNIAILKRKFNLI